MKFTEKIVKKASTIIFAAVLLCTVVGGTFALLISHTNQASNTFTVGNIDITLNESDDLDFHMKANTYLRKDPVITVLANSIDSYLFVEIEEKNNLDTFIEYELSEGWTALGEFYPGIYYRETEASTKDEKYHILKNDKIKVKNVSDVQLNALTDTTLPKLVFAAYAVQKAEIDNAEDAWLLLTEEYVPMSSE